MESIDTKAVRTELASRVGKVAADGVLEIVGLGKGTPAGLMAGRFQLVLVDVEAQLPDCPFLREAKALEMRLRDEADQGSMLEASSVIENLKMADCRCCGWAHACKSMSEAHFGKVVAPSDWRGSATGC